MALGAGNDLGQGFLTDYSGIAGAGAAFQGFAGAYKDAQDQQMKRQELQAKIMAQQEQMKREATMTALGARKEGYTVGPGGPTDLQSAPLAPREIADQDIKAGGEGFNVNRDESGNYQGLAVNPNSPKMIAARMSGARGQAAMMNVGLHEDNMSAGAVNKIHSDPVLVNTRNQATNIDKGLETLKGSNTHKPSWIEVNEVAQDFANALSGNKGSSDFKLKQSEQESFDKYLGDLKARSSSNPDQPADQTYVDFYNQFGNRLKGAYDKQLAARASNKLNGLETAYRHNPNAYQAAKEAAQIYKDGSWRNDPDLHASQAQGNTPAPQSAPAPRPEGLVNQGILGKIGGLLGFGQKPQNAPEAPTQQFSPDVVKYATTHGITPQAAQTIKDQRTKGGQ